MIKILSYIIQETCCCTFDQYNLNGIFSCPFWTLFVLEWKHVLMLVGGFHVNLHHSSEENVFKRHITYKHPSRHLFVEKINSAVRVPYYCQFNYRVFPRSCLLIIRQKSTYSKDVSTIIWIPRKWFSPNNSYSSGEPFFAIVISW